MKYNLAFKYRIYPNKDQELLINKTFGCVRFIYNTILYTANKFYEETGKNKIITPASLKSENQFLKEVDSLALSNAQLNVKRSFTNFFQFLHKFYYQYTRAYCRQNEHIQKSCLSTILALYLDKFCIWMLNYISQNYTSF